MTTRAKTETPKYWRSRLARAPLLALSLACLVAAVWGGLLRLAINLPAPERSANWITFHGPLMVCGFLGTIIGLERAVGLRSWWAYIPPILTGAGAIALVAGVTTPHPMHLIVAGSAAFVIVAWRVVWLQKALFTVLMAVAAMTWLAGNLLWLKEWTFNRVVPWWIAFLALTILGERLDLNRFTKPSRWSRPLLCLSMGLFGGGVILSAINQLWGERMTGAGLLAMSLWLGWFDIARRTVKQAGLTRFMAVCLLAGYVWMAVGGALMLWHAPLEAGQFTYDAALHAFFVGFVFSMIFGHAPVIFPAVLNLNVTYRPLFYGHLALLHAALALRIWGDLSSTFSARQWGAILSAVALVVFLLNTVAAVLLSGKRAGRK